MKNISKKVERNVYRVMSGLGNELTKGSEHYENDNGTVTFEWETEDEKNLLFLEIGKETFGYFVQQEDKPVKYVDEETNVSVLKEDLQNFLYGK